MIDPYNVLGVSKAASDVDIKKAYRKLAMRFHPDHNQGFAEQATERFREIKEAYDMISDAKKRAAYDCEFGKPFETTKNDYMSSSESDVSYYNESHKDIKQQKPRYDIGLFLVVLIFVVFSGLLMGPKQVSIQQYDVCGNLVTPKPIDGSPGTITDAELDCISKQYRQSIINDVNQDQITMKAKQSEIDDSPEVDSTQIRSNSEESQDNIHDVYYARVSEFVKISPDFATVVNKIQNQVESDPNVVDFIVNSEVGPAVVYQLATDSSKFHSVMIQSSGTYRMSLLKQIENDLIDRKNLLVNNTTDAN